MLPVKNVKCRIAFITQSPLQVRWVQRWIYPWSKDASKQKRRASFSGVIHRTTTVRQLVSFDVGSLFRLLLLVFCFIISVVDRGPKTTWTFDQQHDAVDE
jgi:hypothetical protein